MAAMGQYFGKISCAINTVFIGSQIKTNHCVFWAVLHPVGNRDHAVIVKAKAVDDSTVFGQAKQPWLGVAALGVWGRCPDLKKAETGLCQRRNCLSIFVKPCGQPKWIVQLQARDVATQPRRGQPTGRGDRCKAQLQGLKRHPMRPFRIETAQGNQAQFFGQRHNICVGN